MSAITATLGLGTEFAGNKKLIVVTCAPTTSDDTFTLTQAVHGISSLDSIVGHTITAGQDGLFANLQVSITSASAMTVQVKSFNASGAVATDWTGVGVSIALLGSL